MAAGGFVARVDGGFSVAEDVLVVARRFCTMRK
jgi:hypothetical protein